MQNLTIATAGTKLRHYAREGQPFTLCGRSVVEAQPGPLNRTIQSGSGYHMEAANCRVCQPYTPRDVKTKCDAYNAKHGGWDRSHTCTADCAE